MSEDENSRSFGKRLEADFEVVNDIPLTSNFGTLKHSIYATFRTFKCLLFNSLLKRKTVSNFRKLYIIDINCNLC